MSQGSEARRRLSETLRQTRRREEAGRARIHELEQQLVELEQQLVEFQKRTHCREGGREKESQRERVSGRWGGGHTLGGGGQGGVAADEATQLRDREQKSIVSASVGESQKEYKERDGDAARGNVGEAENNRRIVSERSRERLRAILDSVGGGAGCMNSNQITPMQSSQAAQEVMNFTVLRQQDSETPDNSPLTLNGLTKLTTSRNESQRTGISVGEGISPAEMKRGPRAILGNDAIFGSPDCSHESHLTWMPGLAARRSGNCDEKTAATALQRLQQRCGSTEEIEGLHNQGGGFRELSSVPRNVLLPIPAGSPSNWPSQYLLSVTVKAAQATRKDGFLANRR
jgi:hypothetical protein